MEQAYTELDDSYQKALKEKKTYEERLSQVSNQKFQDEERIKTFQKQANKVWKLSINECKNVYAF